MMKTELILDRSFPHGIVCSHCNHTAKVGQYVSWRRQIGTTPVLLHKECMESLLAEMPFEESPYIGNINRQVVDALAVIKEIEYV